MPWEYQRDLLDIFLTYKEVIILKARQLGISWLVAGFALWKLLFTDSGKVLMLSQGEEDAWKLLDKARYIHSNLPDFLRLSQKHQSKGTFDFVDTDSVVNALPSTDKAGRGTDATLIVRDELAQHPYGKLNFVAIHPAIDSGGQIIDLSTIDKFDSENHFTERVNKAMDGAERIDYPSGIVLFRQKDNPRQAMVFLSWKLRPVREEGMVLEDWFTYNILPYYEAYEIEQEYPATIDEALSFPQSVCRFNTESLGMMVSDCREPIRTEYEGRVKIYKEPMAERKCCMVIDPSSGETDPCSGKIIDSRTHDVMAAFNDKIVPDEQARIAYDLYERYYEPFTVVERNGQGVLIVEKLSQMGVRNWFYIDKQRKKAGWWTGNNRSAMIEGLADWVRSRNFIEPDKKALDEFRSFVVTEKNPDGAAIRGKHDDNVMVWAMYIQALKQMPVPAGKVKSYAYRQR